MLRRCDITRPYPDPKYSWNKYAGRPAADGGPVKIYEPWLERGPRKQPGFFAGMLFGVFMLHVSWWREMMVEQFLRSRSGAEPERAYERRSTIVLKPASSFLPCPGCGAREYDGWLCTACNFTGAR